MMRLIFILVLVICPSVTADTDANIELEAEVKQLRREVDALHQQLRRVMIFLTEVQQELSNKTVIQKQTQIHPNDLHRQIAQPVKEEYQQQNPAQPVQVQSPPPQPLEPALPQSSPIILQRWDYSPDTRILRVQLANISDYRVELKYVSIPGPGIQDIRRFMGSGETRTWEFSVRQRPAYIWLQLTNWGNWKFTLNPDY